MICDISVWKAYITKFVLVIFKKGKGDGGIGSVVLIINSIATHTASYSTTTGLNGYFVK
jgi:hypothetical protein